MISQASGDTPIEKYQSLLEAGVIAPDDAQLTAIQALSELQQRLVAASQPETWLAKWKKSWQKPAGPEKGLYFWGGVGRGKTLMMDLFFESLPLSNKLRLHFHRFMHELHERLKAHAGEKNPLIPIADDIASQTCVICFDEFFVSDITDAMLLGGLFEALFKRGVSLVATSNIPPHRLYHNGLQRERFLPAIALIEQHTQIINLDGGIDYRLRTLERASVFHTPNDQQAFDQLKTTYRQLTNETVLQPGNIEIEHRAILTQAQAQGVVWFDFHDICETARSHADYIEISRCFHTVIVSGVPQMEEKDNAAARRFISLVDEFYERHVKLLLSAECESELLYQGTMLSFEFQRTVSRLQEMQTEDYLKREHLA